LCHVEYKPVTNSRPQAFDDEFVSTPKDPFAEPAPGKDDDGEDDPSFAELQTGWVSSV
tara:strand:- start:287 stop:460 length:174 start_codon:yes stop_codon:yes gene_type:complete